MTGFDAGLAVAIGLGVGGLAWVIYQRAAKAVERRTAGRISQMAALIEHADCLLWEAEVDMGSTDWSWRMTLHPSVFCRKLFKGEMPTPGVDLWRQFEIENRTEMDRRARAAMESGQPAYQQEFRAVRDGQVTWLSENVSITPVGSGRYWLVGLVTDITAQREAEAARQQSELMVDRILAQAQCLLWRATVVLREDGVLDWQHFDIPRSQFSAMLFGGRIYEPARGFWNTLKMPEQAEMDQRSTQAILGGAPGYAQQFRAISESGRLFWLNEKVSITRVSASMWSLVGVVTDFTAQHEAEEARRGSELRLSHLLERADTMIWQAQVQRQPGGELAWSMYIPPSELYRRIFKADPDISRGFAWMENGVPEYAEMARRAVEAITACAPGYEQVFHVPAPEGDIWLNEKTTIVVTGPGQWDLVGIISDITARHLAEQAWEATQSRLSRVLELADCLIWEATVVTQPDGALKWRFYTPRSVLYRRIFGEEADEMQIKWEDLNVPEREDMHLRADHAIRARQPGYTHEFHVLKPEGVLWLREVVTIAQISGESSQLVGVITDITAQRLAEQAQRQSETRLATLLDQADCMIWQGGARRAESGGIVWNLFTPNSQLYRRLFGFTPEGRTHFPWGNGLVPEYEEMLARSERALNTGAPGYEQVFQYRLPEGVVWLNEKVSIKAQEAGCWEMTGIITDITVQHSAELARQTSEARLQELLLRADCLFWEAVVALGPGAGEWTWQFNVQPSLLCERIYGVKHPGPEHQLWRGLAIPEFQEMNQRCRQALEQGRTGFDQIFHIIRADGAHLWISETVTVRPLGQGRFSLVGVALDITPLRRAQEALAAEKERLAVTLRAMNECVVTTDVAGLVQFMNPAAAELTEWPADEAIGRRVGEICALQNARNEQTVEVPVARVAQGDIVADLPPATRLVSRRGNRRMIEGCCAPIHAVDSKVIGTVLVFRDVTEQERLEQELVRATRLESVGVLAGGIAHDFNNILTAVMGNLSLAQLDIPADSPAAQSLHSAEKAALRARDLTQQLLTFAKGGEPVRSAVQLEAIVREMTSFALHGSQVKAFYDLAPDLWAADVDKGQIGRVVQNLAINAVQAMPSGGTLRIMARNDSVDGMSQPGLAPGNYIQIAMSDTGEGIKSEHLARIFDPYFTTKQTGTGLGLAAVYSIVKKHLGHIEVESQVRKGTTFRIWLPALRGESAPPEAKASAGPGRIKGRVLFMDDEQIIRDMAVALLKRFGLAVVCAVDGAEAIRHYQTALAEGRRFDLVIMDLTVPGGMGGLAAIQRLREIDPQVRAVVSSGYSSDPVLANYRQHGFTAVVAKPYEVGELARVLREVLAVG